MLSGKNSAKLRKAGKLLIFIMLS